MKKIDVENLDLIYEIDESCRRLSNWITGYYYDSKNQSRIDTLCSETFQFLKEIFSLNYSSRFLYRYIEVDSLTKSGKEFIDHALESYTKTGLHKNQSWTSSLTRAKNIAKNNYENRPRHPMPFIVKAKIPSNNIVIRIKDIAQSVNKLIHDIDEKPPSGISHFLLDYDSYEEEDEFIVYLPSKSIEIEAIYYLEAWNYSKHPKKYSFA